MIRDIFLSVIMPAYNEEENICRNTLLVAEVVEKLVRKYEIIVVDDGSTDRTADNLRHAACQNTHIRILQVQPNQGKGNALRVGTQAAHGNYIMFLDSDLDLSPTTIVDFLDIMFDKKADVVIGSKLHPDSIITYPVIRRFISFVYYLFIRILFRLNVRDTQTGMKLFKAEAIKPVMNIILVKRFAFDIEVLSIINRRKYKIVDAPVILEYGRSASWGRINLKIIWNMLLDTLAIFYRLYIMKYYDRIDSRQEVTETEQVLNGR